MGISAPVGRLFGLPGKPRRFVEFRRIVVPLLDGDCEPTAVACRLAADRGAALTAVVVVEVPAELPLDAQMEEEEASGRERLREARAQAESYGVTIETRLARGREAGEVIVDLARSAEADLVLLRAPRMQRVSGHAPPFGATATHVLKHAPCRVMLLSPQSGV